MAPARTPGTRSTPQTDALPEPTALRRAAWVAGVATWLFLVIALAGFNLADWPSHAVSQHNAPPANPGSVVGAAIAYWALLIAGAGAWLLLGLAAAALVVLATGRSLRDPLLRVVGALLAALAIAGLHATWIPGASVMPGTVAGLLPDFVAEVLGTRFGAVGASLWFLAMLTIGLVVAADELVLRIPGAVAASLRIVSPGHRGERLARLRESLRTLIARPSAFRRPKDGRRRVALAGVDGAIGIDEDEDEDAPKRGRRGASATSTKTKKKRRGRAVEEEPEEEDDDLEDEWEYEYEDVDDADEDGDEDEDDEEYEYEYEYVDEDEDDPEAEYEDDEEEDEDDEETADELDEPARVELDRDALRAKIAKLPVRMGSAPRALVTEDEVPREESFEGYQFPPLDLLEKSEGDYSEQMEQFVRDQAQVLEETLRTFQIDGEVTGIESGPVVTLYAIQLAPGTRVARLNSIASDLARSLQAPNIRIIPTMAGKTTVGIEVPNPKKEKVALRELMSSAEAKRMTLPMFLGKDSAGEPLVVDLVKMPHMLIAGTTGSGKSVCMNTIIMSWLYTKRPDELKMVLVDPKMVEMSQFADIPHLMSPVVTEMSKAAAILEWAVTKMEERYELLKNAGVRDIVAYNGLGDDELFDRLGLEDTPENEVARARTPKKLAYMVFVIDELADLMMTNKEVEHSIVRIAQKARAVGIHLILATQRPQANVVTGLIKSNMPCRVAFKVASGMDSRIVLDQKGAELLLGQGDMMVLQPSSSEIRRCQGTLVTDRETRQVAKFLKTVAGPTFERALVSIKTSDGGGDGGGGEPDASERDPLFDKAVEIMIESGRGSVSLLQRRLAIGYGRASRLVDQMGVAGIVGDHKGSVAREVLISLDEWRAIRAMEAGEDLDEDGGVPDEMDDEYLS